MSDSERCPLCGGWSFEGEPCRPQCDPGALKRKGIDLLPLMTTGMMAEDYEHGGGEAIVTRAKY
jgi:hypothetical protein